MVAVPEFQPGQLVRVRTEGGDASSQPDTSLLGKDGTVWYGAGSEDSDLTMLYFVELDNGEVEVISPDWLELR